MIAKDLEMGRLPRSIWAGPVPSQVPYKETPEGRRSRRCADGPREERCALEMGKGPNLPVGGHQMLGHEEQTPGAFRGNHHYCQLEPIEMISKFLASCTVREF